MKICSRRTFLKMAAALSVGPLCSRPALAEVETGDSDELVQFSPKVAHSFAERFALSMLPGVSIEAEEPVQVLRQDGSLSGYAIDYHKGDIPYGYLVLDTECAGLVSQFLVKEGVPGFFEQVLASNSLVATAVSANSNNLLLVTTGPLSYGIVDMQAGEAYIEGQTLDYSSVVAIADGSESGDTHRWWDVMVTTSDARSTWTISNSGFGVQLYLISEDAVENAIGRYACVVQALYSIGASLPADSTYSTMLIPNPLSVWDDYLKLWDFTGTTTDHNTNGIIYGVTADANIGAGFQTFCFSKDVSVDYTFSSSPSYSDFVTHIRGGQPAIVTLSLNTPNGKEGHSMAIEGYATLSNGSTTMRCLEGLNGWGQVVYINYDFGDYVSKRGTFFDYSLI